jgi:hypothetical protein
MKNLYNTWIKPLLSKAILIDPEFMANQNFHLDRLVEDELIYTSRKVIKTQKTLFYNDLVPFEATTHQVKTLLKLTGSSYLNAKNKAHLIIAIDDTHLNFRISHTLHFIKGEFLAGILDIHPIIIQSTNNDKQLKNLYHKMLSDYKNIFPENSIIQDMDGNMLIPSSTFGIRMIYLSQKLKPSAEVYKSSRPELLPTEEYLTARM